MCFSMITTVEEVASTTGCWSDGVCLMSHRNRQAGRRQHTGLQHECRSHYFCRIRLPSRPFCLREGIVDLFQGEMM